jgi:uncharacterized RDD family membrane protein YckC
MPPSISVSTVLGLVVFPAVLFALVYPWLNAGLFRGLSSPYPKADVRKRLYAGVLDGLLVVSCAILYQRLASWPFLALGTVYVLLRDGVRGQSVGKFFFGLVVMRLESGKPATLRTSATRNILLLIPGVNLAAVVLETRATWHDPQGQRLGDRLAQTQVVEGLGARDLAAEFIEWWNSLLAEMTPAGRRRRLRATRFGAQVRHTIALDRADDCNDPKAA